MRPGRVYIVHNDRNLCLHVQGPTQGESALPDWFLTFKYYFGTPGRILQYLEKVMPRILPVSSNGARVVIERLTFEGKE